MMNITGGIFMKIHDKIRTLREVNQWSQEEMAERMNMSRNGYSKIERGESQPTLERLVQIAHIFNIEISELLNTENDKMIFLVENTNQNGNNYGYSASYYGSEAAIASEIEKLKLVIAHKDEMLAQKDKEILLLKDLVEQLKKNTVS